MPIDQPSLRWRQPRHRRSNGCTRLCHDQLSLRIIEVPDRGDFTPRLVILDIFRTHAPRHTAQLVQRPIACDGHEPADEPSARRVVGDGLPPEAEEHLLHHVLRELGVAEHSQTDGKHERGVTVVQQLQRGNVAISQRGHQLGVSRVWARIRSPAVEQYVLPGRSDSRAHSGRTILRGLRRGEGRIDHGDLRGPRRWGTGVPP